MEEMTKEEKELRMKQYEMHKNFFDRVKEANEHGFYLEAVFLEYAAIEGRLEVILGVLGCPCNKNLPDNIRQKFQISHRIICLKKLVKKNPFFEKTKIDNKFFKTFGEWIKRRNICIHGLYKNGMEYVNRQQDAKELSEKGLEIAKVLYNETNRLKRMLKEPDGILEYSGQHCFAKKCCSYIPMEEKNNEQICN